MSIIIRRVVVKRCGRCKDSKPNPNCVFCCGQGMIGIVPWPAEWPTGIRGDGEKFPTVLMRVEYVGG